MPCSAAMRRIQRSALMLISRFDRDLREHRAVVLVQGGEARGGAARHSEIRAARVRSAERRRRSGHPPSASSRMRMSSGSSPRNCTPYCCRHARSAAAAENVLGMPAIAAHMHAHVLDDSEHPNLHLLEHLESLACVQQRDVLGRGDDDRAAHRHALGERQLDVARTRRHVDHQVIERSPVGFAEQLGQRLRHHGPAPGHGLLGIDHEADGHHLDAVGAQRIRCVCRPESQACGLPRPS